MLEHLRDAEMEEDEGDASPQSFDVTAVERWTRNWTEMYEFRRGVFGFGSDRMETNRILVGYTIFLRFTPFRLNPNSKFPFLFQITFSGSMASIV